MLTAECTYDKLTDSYDVSFSFHRFGGDYDLLQIVLKLIKTSVSASHRTYDPDTKHWGFTSDIFKNVIEPIFKTVNISYAIKDMIYPENTVGPDNFFYSHAVSAKIPESPEVLGAHLVKLLCITEETLKDTIALKKAYRRKALELHPDRNNGDGKAMSTLNEVYNAYTRN